MFISDITLDSVLGVGIEIESYRWYWWDDDFSCDEICFCVITNRCRGMIEIDSIFLFLDTTVYFSDGTTEAGVSLDFMLFVNTVE